MSDPRAIPDEERPFIPEEQIPAKESTDFDAEPAETSESAGSDVDAEGDPEPADSHE
jgi:hypothetical protein